MVIKTQLCGLLITLLIIGMSLMHRRVELKSQRYFRAFQYITLANLLFDISSTLLIYHDTGRYGLLLQILSRAYLISLVLLVFMSYMYHTLEVEENSRNQHIYQRVACGVFGAVFTLLCLLPIAFYQEGMTVYSYGPAVILTYGACFYYIIMTIISLILYRKEIDGKRRATACVWMVIWAGAGLLQMIHNEWLLVGFAAALGLGILYMYLENPEAYIDSTTHLMNQISLTRYMKELGSDILYGAIALVYVEVPDRSKRTAEKERLMRMVAAYLDTTPEMKVFRDPGFCFILLLKDKNYLAGVLEQVQKRFSKHWVLDGKNVKLHARLFASDLLSENVEQTLQDFQNYVYEAKKRHTDEPMVMDTAWLAAQMEEARTNRKLIEAMEEDRIAVYYQPIYSVEQGRFLSAEALVRMKDREGQLVFPMNFISVAEKNGLILQLGEIVFRKVCQFLRDQQPGRLGIEYIEVNISTVQIQSVGFAGHFISIMEEYQISPKQINFEITETAEAEQSNVMLHNIRELHRYGCAFSQDDFGTGYSNLEYFLKLPVGIVKFDRKMVMSYFESYKGKALMKAAIAMLQALDVEIVAEGIETKEQLEEMKTLGISHIQGFYFSKAISENAFLQYVDGMREEAVTIPKPKVK